MKGTVKETKLPRYSEMVRVALTDMKQFKGSTNKDILKYTASKYGLSETTKVTSALDVALKTGVRNGTLIKIDNGYKLVNTEEEKQNTFKTKKGMSVQKGQEKVKEKIAKASKVKKVSKSETAKQKRSKPRKTAEGLKKGIAIGKAKAKQGTEDETESSNKE